MLLGSVPIPPRKPRSWTSTQSARQNATANHSAYLIRRDLPVRKIVPSTTSTITATRFTAKPSLAVNEPNRASSADRICGWEVEDIDLTMPARVPG